MSSVRAPSPPPHAEPVRANSPWPRPRAKTTVAAGHVMAELRRLAGAPGPQVSVSPSVSPSASPSASLAVSLSGVQQLGQGLLQPLYAAGLLLRNRNLLTLALVPALLLLAFCLGVGFLDALLLSHEPGIVGPMLKSALRSFVVLAPVPSIVMANHYGRLCAQAHERLQLGPCRPRRLPLMRAAMLALRQVVVVAVAVLPLSFAAHLLPWVGEWVAKALLLLWALHWIVVEALDDGCVDAAPESHQAAAGRPECPWLPWFLWPVQRAGAFFSGWLGAPLRWFVRRAVRLCSPWRKEISLVEQNLPVMLGFAATTAALLCTPVLNLVFRPITVVAAVRLIGQLRGLSPLTASPPEPSPLPLPPPAGTDPGAAPPQGAS